MKPTNFPERKRQRQLRALQRLLSNNHYNAQIEVAILRLRQERLDNHYNAQIEIAILQRRTQVNLRDVRTKQNRGKLA